MKVFKEYAEGFGPGFKEAAVHWMGAFKFQRLKQESKLIAAVESAFHCFPETAPLELFLGSKLPSEYGEEILSVLESVIRRRPARAVWAHVFRAKIFASPVFNEREKALRDLECASELAPRSSWVHAHKARALELYGRREEAIAALSQAGRLDPECGWIHAWRGALRLKSGLPREALADLNRAVEICPKYHPARLWRGQAFIRLGQLSRARLDLEHALKLEPKRRIGEPVYDRVYADLGQLFRKRKDWPRSARSFIHAFERDSKYGWVSPQNPQECAALLPELERAAASSRDSSVHAWRVLCAVGAGRLDLSGDSVSKLRKSEAFFCLVHAYVEEALGNFSKAFFWLNRAVALKPLAVYRHARGSFLYRRGSAERALKDLSAALKEHAPSAVLLYELSGTALECGKINQASHYLRWALRLDSRLPPVGREESALKTVSRLIRHFPKIKEFRIYRAEIFKRLERLEEALRDWSALIRMFPREGTLRVQRSLLRRLAQDFKGALKDARVALSLNSLDLEARCALSEALRGLGRFPEALIQARRAVRQEPKADYPRLVYAKALRQCGALSAALSQTLQARKFNSRNAKAWALSGEILRKTSRLNEALSALDQALNLDPALAWAWALKGETLRNMGRHKEAFACIERAVSGERAAAFAHDFLGVETGNVRRDPAYAWIYAWRGAVRRRRGARLEALRDFNHALSLDPDCFWARAGRAELTIERQEGNWTETAQDLTEVIRKVPDYWRILRRQ